MTTPNAELAYKVLDQIDAHPEEWDQGHWWATTDCGTTACFAGWAVILAGHKVTPGEVDPDDGTRSWAAIDGDEGALIGRIAAKDLGIDGIEMPCRLCGGECGVDEPVSERLFSGYNDRQDLGEIVAEIFGPRPGGDR